MNGLATPDTGFRPSTAGSLRRPEAVQRTKINVGSATEKAHNHPLNEDTVLAKPDTGIMGVFDGVGGGPKGNVASRVASQSIERSFAKLRAEGNVTSDGIRDAFVTATRTVFTDNEARGGSSTGTAALCLPNADGTMRVIGGSVGDSRLWVLRNTPGGPRLEQITYDHSPIPPALQKKLNDVTSLNQLTMAEAEHFNNRRQIDAALGSDAYLWPTGYTGFDVQLNKGDVALFTSDGIHDNLTATEIARILAANPDPTKAAEELKLAARACANAGGFRAKDDDLSALVVNNGEAGKSPHRAPNNEHRPRPARKHDGRHPNLPRNEARGFLERIAGRPPRPEKPLPDRPKTPDNTLQRPVISDLANLDGTRTQALEAAFREASARKWNKMFESEGFEAVQRKWEENMTAKMNNFSSVGQVRMASLLKDLDVPVEQNEDGSFTVDWDNLSANYQSVEVFMDKIKTIPDIRSRLPEARWLAGIFSSEVARELFTYSPREVKKNQLKSLVNRIDSKYKNEPQKGERLKELARKRAMDPERALSEITFDGKMTVEQRELAKKVLKELPVEMLQDLERVNLISDAEKMHVGGRMMAQGDRYRSGRIGAAISLSGEMLNNENIDRLRLIVYHEVMGHQLMGMVNKLSSEGIKQIRGMWVGVDPLLLESDSNAREYLEGNRGRLDYPRHGVPAAIDEFWADRMAEYQFRIQHNISMKMHREVEYTPEQQEYIDDVCRKTLEIWRASLESNG